MYQYQHMKLFLILVLSDILENVSKEYFQSSQQSNAATTDTAYLHESEESCELCDVLVGLHIHMFLLDALCWWPLPSVTWQSTRVNIFQNKLQCDSAASIYHIISSWCGTDRPGIGTYDEQILTQLMDARLEDVQMFNPTWLKRGPSCHEGGWSLLESFQPEIHTKDI